MQIDQAPFKEFVPEDVRMNFWAAHGIVRKHYCGPMTVKGLCPEDCQKCAARLTDMMHLEQANNPAALLIWSLRKAIALAQEARQIEEHKPQVRENLGFRELDPFEVILAELK
jgi:hypothetical protein